MWVWILTITALGSNPEHLKVAKFQTKMECQQALVVKKQEYDAKGKQIVGTCYFGNMTK